MSFILDALKKSEAERQRQAGPALLEMRVSKAARRLPGWGIALLVLLLLNGLILLWLALGRDPEAAPPERAPIAAAAGVPAASVPAASSPLNAPTPGAPWVAPAPIISGSNVDEVGGAPPFNAADHVPAAAASAPPAAAAPPMNSVLPDYHNISANLPSMQLDLHVYSASAANRSAYINMRRVSEGQRTSEGALVREITPEGVVLNYQGTEFVLSK